MKITTVLGDIEPSALGFCQSHEHLFIACSRPGEEQSAQYIDDPEKSLAELLLYHDAGGRALVDAQPVGCGRDAGVLARLSEQSGVRIIASTGFHRMGYYPEDHWIFTTGEEKLARLFIEELELGMYLDGDCAFPAIPGRARAGQVKTALDTGGLTPQYEKLFGAAATAAKTANCALMAHIEKGSDPLSLADFLEKQGLAPNRLIFCHMDRAIPDISVHKELCNRGIYLEYDTIGRPKYHEDTKELAIISEMLDAGHEKRLLMSLDSTRARLRSYGGVPGLAYIIANFIPQMREMGVSAYQTGLFFTENPAEVFAHGI